MAASTLSRDTHGCAIADDQGHSGQDLHHRQELRQCLRHCLDAHLVLDTQKPRDQRPGVMNREEFAWVMAVLRERPQWSLDLLAQADLVAIG